MDDDILIHYGVLGMHWGVRKDGKPQGYQYGKDGHKSNASNERKNAQRELIRQTRARATIGEKAKSRVPGGYIGSVLAGSVAPIVNAALAVTSGVALPFIPLAAITTGSALAGGIIGSRISERVLLPDIVSANDRRVMDETYSVPFYIIK